MATRRAGHNNQDGADPAAGASTTTADDSRVDFGLTGLDLSFLKKIKIDF
jgi:hypothetical protein